MICKYQQNNLCEQLILYGLFATGLQAPANEAGAWGGQCKGGGHIWVFSSGSLSPSQKEGRRPIAAEE